MNGIQSWNGKAGTVNGLGKVWDRLRLPVLAVIFAIVCMSGIVSWTGKASAAVPCCWIGTTDSTTQSIRVLDTQVSDWNARAALKWSWKPTTAEGFTASEVSTWGGGTDVKLRESSVWGGQSLAIADNSMAAIVSYPSGAKKWAKVFTGGENVHSAELLPNGDIALAASSGNWVRVYSTSQSSAAPAQYDLPNAHAVYWDSSMNVLWAVGDTDLVALTVTGPENDLKLEKYKQYTIPLTDGQIPYGHDVFPVYDNPDRLWVPVNWRVWQFDKSTETWVDSYTGSGTLFDSGHEVKSVSTLPSGQIAYTYALNPTTDWDTDTVSFLNPTDTRLVTGGQIYKARPWIPGYDGTSGEPVDNLALKATVNASSSEENDDWLKANVVDGLTDSVNGTSNGYSSAGGTANHTEWLEIDLPSAQMISSVALYPRNDSGHIGDGFPVDFKIQVWNGSAWLDRVARTAYPKPGNAAQTFAWGYVDYTNKIRIYATNLRPNGTDYRLQFAEVEVNNDMKDKADNEAQGAAVNASSSVENYYWYKSDVTDGLRDSIYGTSNGFSSNFNSADHTEWLEIDFPSARSVSNVVLYPRNDDGHVGDGFPIDFKIQIWNGSAWVDRVSAVGYPKPGNARQSFSWGTTDTTDKIRIYATHLRTVGTDYLMQLAEVEAYS
jgi:hypothetical protein